MSSSINLERSIVEQAPVLRVVGARVNNLQQVQVEIPLGQWTAITGVSGAGKSSLALGTIHAEGQRRYLETLSASARAMLQQLERPDVERIDHLLPSIAVTARELTAGTARFVAETAEILEPLGLLALHRGRPWCVRCDVPVQSHSVPELVRLISNWPAGERFQIAVPLQTADAESVKSPAGTSTKTTAEAGIALRQAWEANGFHRFWEFDASQQQRLSRVWGSSVTGLVLIDRLKTGDGLISRVQESLELAYAVGQQRCVLLREVSAAAENQTRQAGERDENVMQDERGQAWHLLAFGLQRRCPQCHEQAPELTEGLFRRHSSSGGCPECLGQGTVDRKAAAQRDRQVAAKQGQQWKGAVQDGEAAGQVAGQPAGKGAAKKQTCPACQGLGLNAAARAFRVMSEAGAASVEVSEENAGTSISLQQALQLTVDQMLELIGERWLPGCRRDEIARELLETLQQKLFVLQRLGLGYVGLNRVNGTLSAGERQRIGLTTVLSSSLVNTLFVLDEPAAGLSPQDCRAVRELLTELRDRGNTLLMIEHQAELLAGVDYVIELGPGAGQSGGQVMFAGTLQALQVETESLTGAWLAGRISLDLPASVPVPKAQPRLEARGIRFRNLKNLAVEIPLQRLTVLTGVSGSGKTSLLAGVLVPLIQRQAREGSPAGELADAEQTVEVAEVRGLEAIDQAILVDDSGLSGSSRSTLITYLKGYDEIRKLFAETVDAQVKGFPPARFSFNTDKGGRCPRCAGEGRLELDLQFLADLTITCPECHGKRFNRETLNVKFRNRNIYEVLQMTADEAFLFFRNQTLVQRKLQPLRDVGLGYLAIGQPTSLLSAGERQRLKLASLLSTARGKHILYAFDEPAAGLHPADVQTLLRCFRRLVEQGHTVVVIEHHPLFLSTADWVLELGPGPAERGGEVQFQGPPASTAHL